MPIRCLFLLLVGLLSFSLSHRSEAAQDCPALWRQGEPYQAIRCYQAHLETYPNDAQAHLQLGQLLQATHQVPEAQRHWQQAAAISVAPEIVTQAKQWLNHPPDTTGWIPPRKTQVWLNHPPPVIGQGQTAGLTTNLPTGGPDYLSAILYQGQRVRWSLQRPLKLYVEPVGTLAGSAIQAADLVLQSVQPWIDALGGQLTVIPERDQASADISVDFIRKVDQQGVTTSRGILYTSGTTQPTIRKGQLEQMQMHLALYDVLGQMHRPNALYNTAVHEMGHALGLLGHSPNPSDIMHGESAARPNQTLEPPRKRLSQADIATIRRLYNQVPDISEQPPATSTKEKPDLALREMTALDAEIAKREQEATLRATRLNFSNLVELYLQRARLAEKNGSPDQARPWIEKALKTSSQAIAADPGVAVSYYQRATIEELLKTPTQALGDIDQALKIEPGNARYHLEKAWILSQLGQRAQGLNALDTYRRLNPLASPEDAIYLKVKNALLKHGQG